MELMEVAVVEVLETKDVFHQEELLRQDRVTMVVLDLINLKI
jgi:hypothetical protein